MLHSEHITVVADNGTQIFLANDIEKILSMTFDYSYENNTRKNRYSNNEVCDHFDISQSELDRMKYTLTYDFCHNNKGEYRF